MEPPRACFKTGFASDAQAGASLARQPAKRAALMLFCVDERAYWKQSVIEEQRSQVDARPADEVNAVLKQAPRVQTIAWVVSELAKADGVEHTGEISNRDDGVHYLQTTVESPAPDRRHGVDIRRPAEYDDDEIL